VTVVDTTPPSITCPAAITNVQCTDLCGQADPGAAMCTDACAAPGQLTITNAQGGCFPYVPNNTQQTTTVTNFSCSDEVSNSTSCTSSVTVIDTLPPVVTINPVSQYMWPPDHKMHTFDITTACGITIKDQCQGTITSGAANTAIDYVTTNEKFLTNGSGNTPVDILIVNSTTVQLRSERSGPQTGRVYSIHFTVTDQSGNTTDGVCNIDVDHDQGPQGLPHGNLNVCECVSDNNAIPGTIVLPGGAVTCPPLANCP
jgi:hypothetical protein